MSRFWAAGDSSSEGSSSSDDSSVSSDDSSRGGGAAGGGAGGNRWVMDSESESEDEVRVVKSAKERAFEQFETHVSAIRNAMKIKDHPKISSELDELIKKVTKAQTLINRHGGIPRFFVRLLCDLEDFVAENLADKVTFKKMKPANGRALKRMKLTLNKHNRQYVKIMEEYRKNPVESSSSDEESSDDSDSDDSDSDSDSDDDTDSDSDDSAPAKKTKAPVKKKAAVSSSDESSSGSDSDSDSDSDGDSDDKDEADNNDNGDDDASEWGSGDSSSSSSESEAEFGEAKGRARWLKKTTDRKSVV